MCRQICFLAALILETVCVASGQMESPSVQSYTGKRLILRYFGGQKDVALRKDDFEKHRNGCAVAVEVRRAAFKHHRLVFQFEKIGSLVVRNQPIRCTEDSRETSLTISHFTGTESSEEVKGLVAQFLQTPEAYLAAHGIVLQPSDPAGDAVAIDFPHPGVTRPELLLMVLPFYPPILHFLHIQGVVRATGEVGTDGIIHDYRVASPPDPRLTEAVLRVFPLIRYQPARQGDKPVRVRMSFETSFSLDLN
jgi:hypothetical protein